MSSLTALAHPDIGAAVVTLDVTAVADAFTRSVSNGWGSADTGQAYTTSGATAGNYSVNGSKGVHTLDTVNVFRHSTISVGSPSMRVRATVNLNVGAVTGAATTAVVAARVTDTSNYYAAHLSFNTDDSVTLLIAKRVAGTLTNLSSAVTVSSGFGSGQQFTVDLEVAGDTIRAKAWATTTSGPTTSWLVTATDTDLTAGTSAGLFSRHETGSTTGTVQVQWDDLVVEEAAEPWHIWRVYPDDSEVELLGSPTYPSAGYAVMWDTVLPLDVPVYYRANSDYSTTILTSNTITVTGTGQGWLKDPARPVNDVLLGDCPGPVCPLDVDNDDTSVSFLRLGQGTFASATGVFPIIDTARPRTVAQTRKARESTLSLLSHTLEAGARVEDILATGRNLLLQLTSRYGWAYRNWNTDYITVGEAAEDRPPGPNMTWPHRAWSLPFILARAPYVASGRVGGNGIGVNGATYGDATATGRTYAERTATGNTYLESARGENL
jgi:hypothetical protein